RTTTLIRFAHRDRVFDLQSGIRQHQFFLRDAGHTKSSTQHITADRVDDVLVVSLLNQRNVIHAIHATDDADVRKVRRRWGSNIDLHWRGPKLLVGGLNHYLASTRIGDE